MFFPTAPGGKEIFRKLPKILRSQKLVVHCSGCFCRLQSLRGSAQFAPRCSWRDRIAPYIFILRSRCGLILSSRFWQQSGANLVPNCHTTNTVVGMVSTSFMYLKNTKAESRIFFILGDGVDLEKAPNLYHHQYQGKEIKTRPKIR